jgi:hypothetical protein
VSVLASDVAARPLSAEAKPRIWRAFARALPWRQGSEQNPYSPALCIAMLLTVGLIVKIGPAIHAYLQPL